MTKFQLLAIFTVFTLLSPIAVLAVASPPAIPLLVYGNAAIDGQAAPISAKISAEIDGNIIIATMVKAGKYFIEIPDGKDNEGKMITFKINEIVNGVQLQCVNIATTPSINFDLAVTTPAASSPSPVVSTGGGGVPTLVPQTSIKGDITGDGKVDKYDFSLMMANWGKTGPNDCDLNNDNKVDKYDFALLMSNWNI